MLSKVLRNSLDPHLGLARPTVRTHRWLTMLLLARPAQQRRHRYIKTFTAGLDEPENGNAAASTTTTEDEK